MLVNFLAEEVEPLIFGIDIQGHGAVFLNEQVGTLVSHQTRKKFIAYHAAVLVLRARAKDNAAKLLRLAFAEEIVGNLVCAIAVVELEIERFLGQYARESAEDSQVEVGLQARTVLFDDGQMGGLSPGLPIVGPFVWVLGCISRTIGTDSAVVAIKVGGIGGDGDHGEVVLRAKDKGVGGNCAAHPRGVARIEGAHNGALADNERIAQHGRGHRGLAAVGGIVYVPTRSNKVKNHVPHLIIYARLFVKLRCRCYHAASRCGIFRPRCGRTEIVKPYPALCAANAGALHRVLRADTIYEFAFVQKQKGLGIAQFDIGLLLGIGGFFTAETNQPNLAGL